MGNDFYTRLFEIDPELRKLFERERGEHAMQLIQVFAFIVSKLRAPKELLPIVRDLGRRHRGYGALEPHFLSFRQALLHTLQQRLKDDWTNEVAEAWGAVFDLLAKEMLQE